MHQLLTVMLYASLEALAGHTALAVIQAPHYTNQSWGLPSLLAHLKRLTSPNSNSTMSTSSKVRPSETCQGYYDVMGQYDAAFNCTTGGYRFCCGTCQYRFCCDDRSRRLEQGKCRDSPQWYATTIPGPATNGPNVPNSKQQSNSTVYVICGVISFTLAVGVGIKFFFSKASRRPHGRELNVPRALVDILRHQAGTTSCSERNNSLVMNSNFQDNGSARPPKNLYNAVKPSKSSHDNMHHNYIHLNVNSPKHHTATLDWHMNDTPSHSSTKYNTLSCSRSFHNLSHLPPSYESAIKSELNRYSSLKRLAAEKDLDEFYAKRRHLAELTRGTLPLHAMKMNYDRDSYSEKSHNPRRVMSQEHILSDGGNGVGSYRPSHYDYTIPRERVISHERLLSRENLHSQEHLLSPERLHQHTGPFQEMHLGHQKAVSQTNVCASSTPMLDHHHMMMKNSHPTSNNSPKASAPWETSSSSNQAAATRRQGFASKRQSTIDQVQFIPGHHPTQHLPTGSKNEVTV
ncbi:protein shisa-7 [Thamnophis elegans]|uniref:protein shisa-7 n=1 Tax=Thamnophis elegans TaxID=35005 RepID=UPI001376B182|nr:protein shisa-7 [Thamnophis elegans]